MIRVTSNELLSTTARASTSSVIRDLLRLVDEPGMLSLAGGLPAGEMIPTDRLSSAAASVLQRDRLRPLQYSPSEGMVELRASVARRYGKSRLEAGDFMITTGSQQGIDLLMRTLVDTGDAVVMSSPSYLGAIQAARASGARLVGVPCDDDGLDVEMLASFLRDGLRPKAVYVVTDFANPDGATLTSDRRRMLAGLADRYGFVVIEDNPYGELRWGGDQPEPMWTLTDMAATVGSASKILSPGLRIGWLSAPPWLFSAVARLKQATDLHTSSLDQLIAAEVLDDSAFLSQHLTAVRATYEYRAGVLVDALRHEFGDDLTVREPDGGMFVWATLAGGASTADLFERAIECQVAFVPGAAFSVASESAANDPVATDAGSSMRLCFTTLAERDLREAAARLAAAHRSRSHRV